MSEDEKILIEQSVQGDLTAFESLIKPYEARIYNFLVKMCKGREIAEDLMQDTFINAFRKIESFRSEAKFSTWLFQIASNNCLMHKRKTGKRVVSSLDEPLNSDGGKDFFAEVADWKNDPADLFEKDELKAMLDDALAQIPEIYRAVFLLKDVEGFKAKEIAEMLNISLSNVKARVLRGRAMLQEILKDKLVVEL